jgi:preprotein translocase subunit YajC
VLSNAFYQDVTPKAGTPGVAQEPVAPNGGQAPTSPSFWVTFFPFLIFIPLLFMMFRRQKKEAQQRASLKKGDRVASQSGLVGELVELEERFAKVKIAPGTTVQMLTSSLTPLDTTPPKADAKDASKPAVEKK